MLVALASAKGSPGVTTLAIALAAVWPATPEGRGAVLAECDPAGGDVALRLRGPQGRLAQDLGMMSLAAAVRTDTGPGVIERHLQRLDGGLQVLAGPPSAAHAANMTLSWQLLATTLAGWPGTVLADCGRIAGGSPAESIIAAADYTILLTTPHLDAIAHLRHTLAALTRPGAILHQRGDRIGIVLTCTEKQARTGLRECAQILHHAGHRVPVLGRFGHDPDAAAGLRGQWSHRLDNSDLVGTARELVHATVRAVAAPAPAFALRMPATASEAVG